MIVPLGYVTTCPAARNASTCERESGVRIIWRRSSPIVSTHAPQVGSLRILHGRNDPLTDGVGDVILKSPFMSFGRISGIDQGLAGCFESDRKNSVICRIWVR